MVQIIDITESLKPVSVERVQAAARIIEMDGDQGIQTTRERYGFFIADTIMTIFLLWNYTPENAQAKIVELGLLNNIADLGILNSFEIKREDFETIRRDGAPAFFYLTPLRMPNQLALIAVTSVLRLKFGAMNYYPPNPEIDTQVLAELEKYQVPLVLTIC